MYQNSKLLTQNSKRLTFLLVLLVSCVPEQFLNQAPVFGSVECWDGSFVLSFNDCPESNIVYVIPAVENVSVEISSAVKQNFSGIGYALEDRLVVRFGNFSRIIFPRLFDIGNGSFVTDVFVSEGSAVGFCDIERESRFVPDFDWKRSRCRAVIDVPLVLSFGDWAPRGPVELVEEFSNLEPIRVESAVRTVNIGGAERFVSPSLFFEGGVVLWLDSRYGVPIKVEGLNVSFRNVFFDSVVLDGRPVKIDHDLVVYHSASEHWKTKEFVTG